MWKKFSFTKPFYVQYKIKDNWETLESTEYAVKEIVYVLKNDGIPHQYALSLEELYGYLPVGEYRICVEESGSDVKTYYGYFSVTEAE